MKIHHLGLCALTGERCVITAEYKNEINRMVRKRVRASVACSLGLCDRQEDCREYNHFPAEYAAQ